MSKTRFRLMFVCFLVAAWNTVGCSSRGDNAPKLAAEQATPAKSDDKQKDNDTKDKNAKEKGDKEEHAKKKEKKQREQQHKLAKLNRDLEVARLKEEKAGAELQFAEMTSNAAVAKAEEDVRDATRELANFRQHSAASRMGWSQLGLDRAQDRVDEDGEELAQLEMMYSDEQLEDRTKEIVLGRGQRRLERSQRDLELRQKDFANLREFELPTQERNLEQKLTQAQRSLEQAQHNAVVGTMDKRIKHVEAIANVERLEFEVAEQKREIAEADDEEEDK